jgi:hypothetical protein
MILTQLLERTLTDTTKKFTTPNINGSREHITMVTSRANTSLMRKGMGKWDILGIGLGKRRRRSGNVGGKGREILSR